MQRWISLSLNALVVMFELVLCVLAVTLSRGDTAALDPTLASLAIVYSLQLLGLSSWTIMLMSLTENALTAVERLLAFEGVDQEEQLTRSGSSVARNATEGGGGGLGGGEVGLAIVSPGSVRGQSVGGGEGRESSVSSANASSLPSLPPSWPQNGAISFKHVSMRYRRALPLALRDLTFSVLPGERVGIVGRTGAGKSSIMTALFRLFPCEEGLENGGESEGEEKEKGKEKEEEEEGLEAQGRRTGNGRGSGISIDGVDVTTVPLPRLRSSLGLVTQDPTLFSASIRYNLDPFSTKTDAELWSALERAQLKSAVAATADGLDYEVGENGENLSHGQRQLLCIARVLLKKDCRVLLCDEATSSVDEKTDARVRELIRTAFRGVTVLTIAHRLSSVIESDKIVVMEAGRAVEVGTPAELRAKEGGIFRGMLEGRK